MPRSTVGLTDAPIGHFTALLGDAVAGPAHTLQIKLRAAVQCSVRPRFNLFARSGCRIDMSDDAHGGWRAVTIGDVVVETGPVPGGTRFRRHEHEGPHVCCVLGGGFVESRRGGSEVVCPGTVRVSSSARHDIDFAPLGARCAVLHLPETAAARESERAVRFLRDPGSRVSQPSSDTRSAIRRPSASRASRRRPSSSSRRSSAAERDARHHRRPGSAPRASCCTTIPTRARSAHSPIGSTCIASTSRAPSATTTARPSAPICVACACFVPCACCTSATRRCRASRSTPATPTRVT